MKQVTLEEMQIGDEILIYSHFGSKTVIVTAIRDGWNETEKANFFTVICRDFSGQRVYLGYNKDVPNAMSMLGEEYYNIRS